MDLFKDYSISVKIRITFNATYNTLNFPGKINIDPYKNP